MTSNRTTLRAQEPVTYTCALCDSEDGVRWHCNDCQEHLCDRCKEFHQSGRKTKNDDIVSILEANRQGHNSVPEVCKLHPGKLCDVYCCDCDILMCMKCFSQTHKQHKWEHFEDKIGTIKQHFQGHKTAISSKIAHFQNDMSTRSCAYKMFTEDIVTIRTEVNSQREKLKAEVDTIADAVLSELESLEKEESTAYQKDCQQSEKTVGELTCLLENAEMTDTSSLSIFERERSMRKTLPLYDVNVKDAVPKQPCFSTGCIDHAMLTKMLGELRHTNPYDKIDSKHVRHLSSFAFTHHNKILGICPVDDSHAWLSIHKYKGLLLANKDGVIKETVILENYPHKITMFGATDLLITTFPERSYVYKLSLPSKQVTAFADISPHKAYDISTNEKGEVLVSTDTQDIVVLNDSGRVERKVKCEIRGYFIACLSTGDVAVLDFSSELFIVDNSGATRYKWTGELDNGQQVDTMNLWKMTGDKYGNLFVPDSVNNQVYVLPRDSTQAVCLFDQKHVVIQPTVVGVDAFGDVWIGCNNGTVQVMRLSS